jgi:NAD(P)H-dependent flavin oxidoreductase YrpB (nitropropane dioxygenase family)
MGIGLSDWRLARAVSGTGQLGTVAGSGVWIVMTRRLQDGDVGGHIRRALDHFPFPGIAAQIREAFFVDGGRARGRPYRTPSMLRHPLTSAATALLVAASFVEVWLAKEGHEGVVAVNYLEKIQLSHLPSLYGAMLAGVDYVIMGAGIPQQIPGALDRLARGEPATYRLAIADDAPGAVDDAHFDPSTLGEPSRPTTLRRPYFLPIVSSNVLAAMLMKRSTGRIDGFIVEGPTAGGHNAPPRSRRRSGDVPPGYGQDDEVDLVELARIGLPFWLAGSRARRGSLDSATASGAHGIQVGSLFALSRDSALRDDLRAAAIERALRGALEVRTNFSASPSGFPFKEAHLDGTITDAGVGALRRRTCDLGALRTPYRAADGSIGYRCSAEPPESFVRKGGDGARSGASRCLCNALMATVGRAQIRRDGSIEPPIVTLGSDLGFLDDLAFPRDYSAADAIAMLLGLPPA